MSMIFDNYINTKKVYHIISIIDLNQTLENGIKYDDKKTYKTKYYDFHDFIDKNKLPKIPDWVIRKRAIFASINFPESHKFHSHTAILGIKIDPLRCWVANENLANKIYEPFILQDVKDYSSCKNFIENRGKEIIERYWETSLSFHENLEKRYNEIKGYDAEILILHDVEPQDIEVMYIISDHNILTEDEWKRKFCS